MRLARIHALFLAPMLVGACYTFPSGTPKASSPPTATDDGSELPEAPPPAPDVDEETSEPAVDDVATDAATDAAGDADVDVAPEPAPEGPTVASVCESLCKTVDERCDKHAARRCRGQCKIYVSKAEGCEPEYRTALECQAGAEQKELCGNVVAGKCIDEFRAVKRCERGEKPAGGEKPAAAPELPDGWKMVTDGQLHFTIALPASAAVDPDAKRRTWRAPEGDVEYVVAQLPTPGKAVTSQVLLKLVIGFVGYKCQKNLKLHGQFEIEDEVAIRFDSMCHDGTEWHGMLRARPDQALATAYQALPTSSAVLDKFIYSYKRLP